MIDLDNEVDLWPSRMRVCAAMQPARSHRQAGTKITYAEVVQLSVDYAGARKM